MYYDAHTHLNSPILFPKWKEYIKNFIEIWWKGIINVWADKEYNQNWLKIVQDFDFDDFILKTTLGRHPSECVEWKIVKSNLKEKMQRIKDRYYEYKNWIIAIWEAGIDLYYDWAIESLDIQKELFLNHCDLAQELNLPLVVHSRNAFDQTLDVLKNYKDLTVYFHCRGYWPEEIKKLKNFGLKNLFVGFCGNVTYKKADDLRESLKLVWEDQLLLETDAPYLSPQIVRWTQNEPANVRYIYDYVAEFLWKEKNALQGQIQTNFLKVYNL